MDRKSIKAVRLYSKYGVFIFCLYVIQSKLKNYFSKNTIIEHGWNYDFSLGQAPNKIQVREISDQFQNLSKVDLEKSKVQEDTYPLT